MNTRDEPIGYFYYIDDGFRWDSLLAFAKVRPVKTEEQPVSDPICPGGDKPVSGPIYKAGGDVTTPKAIRAPDPEYSELARQNKISGTITLSVVADVDGCAKNIEVVKKLGYGLDQQAVEALRTWQFKPGMKNGEPVPVRVHVDVDFQMH